MKLVRTLIAAALFLLPLVAAAADLPVTFTTQERDLKVALAGTTLTFSLYNDAACTNLVYTTPILIEDVALITKIKQFTPKNDTKLPKTLALQHTLAGVTAHGNLYLKVTGTGVVPIPGPCQAQAATVPAPTCNDAIQNQHESDVDCGGGNCVLCSLGDTCVVNQDCNTMNCQAGICGMSAPDCGDSIMNQDETDVDCGGAMCPGCSPGLMCSINSDCATNNCVSNVCQP